MAWFGDPTPPPSLIFFPLRVCLRVLCKTCVLWWHCNGLRISHISLSVLRSPPSHYLLFHLGRFRIWTITALWIVGNQSKFRNKSLLTNLLVPYYGMQLDFWAQVSFKNEFVLWLLGEEGPDLQGRHSSPNLIGPSVGENLSCGFYQKPKLPAAKVRITSFIWQSPDCPGCLAHTSAQSFQFRGKEE